jgi:hypothetical protein
VSGFPSPWIGLPAWTIKNVIRFANIFFVYFVSFVEQDFGRKILLAACKSIKCAFQDDDDSVILRTHSTVSNRLRQFLQGPEVVHCPTPEHPGKPMSETQKDLKSRLVAETKSLLGVWFYLALLLGSFATYRRLLLAEYHISFFRYGFSIVEAFVLAKVIILGRMMGLGERYLHRPLIVPTLYKTMGFSILVFAFTILEHLVLGRWHGKGPAEVMSEVMNQSIWSILAQVLVLYIALVPLFAVWEMERVLGEGILFDLFFKRKGSATPGAPTASGVESDGYGGAIPGPTIRISPHRLRPNEADFKRTDASKDTHPEFATAVKSDGRGIGRRQEKCHTARVRMAE